ncbi:MAG: hypothetical protein DYH20_10360 [Gammaproteobacteria bacterium PRO9]|nr:hypothetical protein [Gammaproteobacteria bacterium PRO9]
MMAGMAPAAHAYLDPSTGSMILSAIVGIFATLGLAIKTYWYKLKNLLKGSRAAEAKAEAQVEPKIDSRIDSRVDPGAGRQAAGHERESGADPG